MGIYGRGDKIRINDSASTRVIQYFSEMIEREKNRLGESSGNLQW